MSFYNILEYLIIYSFLGWIMETIFRSICEKKIINTGFLHGPVCPIYGIGAIIMLTCLQYFKDNIIILFIASFLILTIWEYLVGIFLEKAFQTKYWDYSNHKINFQGRICLTNSIMWGILGVVFIRIIHPFIQSRAELINEGTLKCVIYVALIIIIIDTILTIIKVKNIKGTLDKIEKINEEIKEKIKEIRSAKQLKSKDKEVSVENLQLVVRNLRRKQKRILLGVYKQVYRLKNAFPAIDSKEFTEVLNKKIEIKKLTQKIKRKTKER